MFWSNVTKTAVMICNDKEGDLMLAWEYNLVAGFVRYRPPTRSKPSSKNGCKGKRGLVLGNGFPLVKTEISSEK